MLCIPDGLLDQCAYGAVEDSLGIAIFIARIEIPAEH